MERFHNLFAFVLLFGVFHVTIERENFELAPGRWFLFWWLSFVYGAANYIVVFGIFVWLSVCTNSAYFWYRKRRIYGLSDGQKYFVYSLNVHPKLYLEHFNVYFRLVPWTGHALAALQMLVSSRFEPCPTPRISYFYFAPKQSRAVYLLFPFIEINNKGWNLRKIGRLVFKQLLLTGFVSVKSVRTKDLLSGSRTSKASHHFSSYRVIEQA